MRQGQGVLHCLAVRFYGRICECCGPNLVDLGQTKLLTDPFPMRSMSDKKVSLFACFQALKSILIQMYGSKDFLNSHLGFIAAEAASPVLVDAFLAFKRGWDEFRPSDALRMRDLQIAYIYANPNAVGSKDNLDHAQGDEYYHLAHQRYHPTYRAILYERNYYDIFIFDLQGNLIYSVYKELDYATNFLAHGSGEWKDSGLGEAFRAAVRNPDIINIIDWKPYGPSSGGVKGTYVYRPYTDQAPQNIPIS